MCVVLGGGLARRWTAPFMIVIPLVLLYGELGGAAFAGFGVMFFVLMLSGCLMAKIQKYEKGRNELSDKRVNLLNEIIQGIKILKFYTCVLLDWIYQELP